MLRPPVRNAVFIDVVDRGLHPDHAELAVDLLDARVLQRGNADCRRIDPDAAKEEQKNDAVEAADGYVIIETAFLALPDELLRPCSCVFNFERIGHLLFHHEIGDFAFRIDTLHPFKYIFSHRRRLR